MNIVYKNNKIRKVCTDVAIAERIYGKRMADKIHQRIGEIRAADTAEALIKLKVGRCHQLKGNRKNQYAIDLVHPYRLIFERKYGAIQIANIIEIVDYH